MESQSSLLWFVMVWIRHSLLRLMCSTIAPIQCHYLEGSSMKKWMKEFQLKSEAHVIIISYWGLTGSRKFLGGVPQRVSMTLVPWFSFHPVPCLCKKGKQRAKIILSCTELLFLGIWPQCQKAVPKLWSHWKNCLFTSHLQCLLF